MFVALLLLFCQSGFKAVAAASKLEAGTVEKRMVTLTMELICICAPHRTISKIITQNRSFHAVLWLTEILRNGCLLGA